MNWARATFALSCLHKQMIKQMTLVLNGRVLRMVFEDLFLLKLKADDICNGHLSREIVFVEDGSRDLEACPISPSLKSL